MAGVYTVQSRGVVNPAAVRIVPGALIQVESNGGPAGPSLQPLDTGRGFDIGQVTLEDLRMNIKKHLMNEALPLSATHN